MEIPEVEHNFEIYFKLIKQAADSEQCDSNEKLAELAEEVFEELVGIEKARANKGKSIWFYSSNILLT